MKTFSRTKRDFARIRLRKSIDFWLANFLCSSNVMEINLSKLIISLIKIFVYIHTYFLPLFFTVRYKYKTIYEYNIVSNYLGKKTASSRSILAFEVEKQKLENLKKRKTVFYYLSTYTTSYKNIHIYIYIYIFLYTKRIVIYKWIRMITLDVSCMACPATWNSTSS